MVANNITTIAKIAWTPNWKINRHCICHVILQHGGYGQVLGKNGECFFYLVCACDVCLVAEACDVNYAWGYSLGICAGNGYLDAEACDVTYAWGDG
jgi:hypothetical protein